MIRLALLTLLAATPAAAWEVTATPVCTLSHDMAGLSLTITHDPRLAEPYAITLTRPAPWPDAPVFALRFDGDRPGTITTGRHRTGAGSLTVTDRGFGNLLDGFEFNGTATALIGDQALAIPLDGAAPAVAAFRACATAPAV